MSDPGEPERSSADRAATLIVAIVACKALLLQYVLILMLTLQTPGLALGTLRYFSYFTILSNLLVMLTCALPLLAPASRAGRFFLQPWVRAGVALCIGVTGVVYVGVLSALWSPQGVQWLADVALHHVVPALYLLLWLVFAPHPRLRWSDALRWLAFPLVYLVLVLARGAWLGEYPYPFIDAAALGAATVARNSVAVAGLFLALGLALVAIDRLLGRLPGSAVRP